MSYYIKQGLIPTKRHTQFRREDGRLRYEELFGKQGFEGRYCLLYHETFPIELLGFEPGDIDVPAEWEVGVRRNHRWETNRLESSGDAFEARRLIAFNDDVAISIATPDKVMSGFFRNAQHDELIIVAEGTGVLSTPFGILNYGPGDMLVIPRGTIQHIAPDGSPSRMLVLESKTDITPPSRYFVTGGQFAEHSPFCERDVRVPILQTPRVEEGEFRIVSKHGDGVTVYTHPNHPFDVVGWDGTNYPYAINIENFEPVTRRIHTMPDEQQAFGTDGAAILCFVPRLAEWHPDALPAPPVHANLDCDEILFSLGGAMPGRRSTAPGEITWHPRGLLHGPKMFEGMVGLEKFEGLAVAIDTFRPLKPTQWARACDDPEYHLQWKAEVPLKKTA